MPTDFRYPGPPRTWPQIQLLRRVMRANALLRDLHEPHFAAIDLPMVEFDLLSALGNTDGMRMKALSQAMTTTPSNVTRVCLVMEEKGLVQRQRAPGSDREVIARLTPAGQALFDELFPKTVNYSAGIIDTALTADEARVAAEILEKLIQAARRPGTGS
ncbi:MarR family winged helix-turn-helix transcriptional regulator [Myxococcota bacterium]|nr:MarR family winged helix-turn-helix transcriptional regulator [Myxococcota bacterium]